MDTNIIENIENNIAKQVFKDFKNNLIKVCDHYYYNMDMSYEEVKAICLGILKQNASYNNNFDELISLWITERFKTYE